MTQWSEMDSPVGRLTLLWDGALIGVEFDGAPRGERSDRALAPVRGQLEEYFARRRERFDLPMAPAGTPFQRAVWAALARIPYGRTVSYGDIARQIGRPRAVRAVGAANGHNPIAIIVPCHRVIGADGSLTGYGGGMPRKRWLLEHERALLPLESLAR